MDKGNDLAVEGFSKEEINLVIDFLKRMLANFDRRE
jgi:hypothetical protein